MLKKAYKWVSTRTKAYKYAWKMALAKLAYDRGDYERAYPVFEKYAEQGLVRAQDLCGDCCYHGNGTAQDIEKALHWSVKAAEQGNLNSVLRCVRIYSYGSHKELKKAEQWLHTALTAQEEIPTIEAMNAHLGLFIGWAEEWIENLEIEDSDAAELKAEIEELVAGWNSIFSNDSLMSK